jgi:hypothetical protein
MDTTKTSPDPGIKTGSKKGAGKKHAKKKRSKLTRLAIGDPPIIVGGGGSTYVWIKKSVFDHEILNPATVNDPDITAPDHPNLYRLFECDVNVTEATVKKKKGTTPSPNSGMDPKTHATVFNV